MSNLDPIPICVRGFSYSGQLLLRIQIADIRPLAYVCMVVSNRFHRLVSSGIAGNLLGKCALQVLKHVLSMQAVILGQLLETTECIFCVQIPNYFIHPTFERAVCYGIRDIWIVPQWNNSDPLD